MPVALPALAGLGELAALLLAIIVLYAAYLLAQVLTALFQYVPLIGGWIQNNLLSHVVDAISASIGWTVSAMGHAVGLIWTPITWIGALFQRIGEAIWSGVQAAQRIVTTTIPNALNMAAAYAQQLYHSAIGYADRIYHSAVAVPH